MVGLARVVTKGKISPKVCIGWLSTIMDFKRVILDGHQEEIYNEPA